MNNRLKHPLYVIIIISIVYLTNNAILLRNLQNDVYVLKKIKNKIDPEFQYIELSEVMRKNHPESPLSTSPYRYFFAYQQDPNTYSPNEIDFYVGYIDLFGKIHVLPKNLLMQ